MRQLQAAPPSLAVLLLEVDGISSRWSGARVHRLDVTSRLLGIVLVGRHARRSIRAERTAIAALCAVRASLTVVNVLRNKLDVASAEMLAAVAKEKVISLCGIKRDQTEANFRNSGLEPCDAILLASDLSQAGVTPSLTSLSVALT